ncbi:MAG: sulfur reduction protein DsrS [Acidiferrobacteraceae bacterium]
MELSPEDSLRLHVLLNSVQAVRIDGDALEVHGLGADVDGAREACVTLNPNCRTEQYLKHVREFLSGAVLGSPGGYPLHLARWTRMGQRRDAGLDKLLLLGEPEAVAAVAGAPGLTDELARRVWWIAPTSEHARRMLEREPVRQGVMGPVLAKHLVDHLPFETDGRVIMDTVRLIVQPGLISEGVHRQLWERGARQPAYRLGFVQADPDHLPDRLPERPDLDAHMPALAPLAAENDIARVLLRALSSAGQSFTAAAISILRRPSDQDVVAAALDAIGAYFRPPGASPPHVRDIATAVRAAAVTDSEAAAAVIRAAPALQKDISALRVLAEVTETVVADILAHTTASGTLLQRKLAPVLDVVLEQLVTIQPRA